MDRQGNPEQPGLGERVRATPSEGSDSSKAVFKQVTVIDRPPPTNFPPVVTIRFDVAEEATEPVLQMKKTSQRRQGTMAELNITPLLDLVFVLLVIFIITTPQLMNNLELTLPSGKPPPKNPHPPKVHHIDLNAQGVILLDNAVGDGAAVEDATGGGQGGRPGAGRRGQGR